VDYVLRLRPDCGFNIEARFEGATEVLHGCVHRLLHSGWMHWWDAVDYVAEDSAAFLRVAIHCPPEEAQIFEEQLARVALESSARLALSHVAQPTMDGLPDITVKTTPERAIGLASQLARDTGRCVALCYNGVVHVYLDGNEAPAERAHLLMQPHIGQLHAIGGDWHSRWLPATPPNFTESQWIETLERTIHAS
jgi:hypothetical protein